MVIAGVGIFYATPAIQSYSKVRVKYYMDKKKFFLIITFIFILFSLGSCGSNNFSSLPDQRIITNELEENQAENAEMQSEENILDALDEQTETDVSKEDYLPDPNLQDNDFAQAASPSDYIIKEKNGIFTIKVPGKYPDWGWFDPNNFWVSYSEEDDNDVILHGTIVDGTELYIRPLDKLNKLNYTHMFDIRYPDKHGYIDNGILLRFQKGEWKEYQGFYYYFSPLQKHILIFPFDYNAPYQVIDLITDEEYVLPPEANHGSPIYNLGTTFSSSEEYLLYENWQDYSLHIYDFQENVETAQISEKEFYLLEASWSPDEKIIAYLKWDKDEPFIYTEGDGRPPVGHIASIYDLNEKKVILEITGKPYIYGPPIWSPDGKQLILNMAEHAPNNIDLIGNPHRYDLETGELVELITPVSGMVETVATAWSAEGDKILIKSIDQTTVKWSYWEVDIHTGVATEIDKGKQYVSISNQMGTSIYELIAITNPIFEETFGDRIDENRVEVFPGGRYALFRANDDQLIVAPLN